MILNSFKRHQCLHAASAVQRTLGIFRSCSSFSVICFGASNLLELLLIQQVGVNAAGAEAQPIPATWLAAQAAHLYLRSVSPGHSKRLPVNNSTAILTCQTSNMHAVKNELALASPKLKQIQISSKSQLFSFGGLKENKWWCLKCLSGKFKQKKLKTVW